MGRGKTYSWFMIGDEVYCHRSPDNLQHIIMLRKSNSKIRTRFHDEELAKATNEINAILSRIEKNNTNPDRKLAFIITNKGPYLVWSKYGVVGPHDDENLIEKALGLK